MISKILIGIILGIITGMSITTMFVPKDTVLIELFLTKITATSIITGVFCGIYAHLNNSKLQTFIVSILIGIAVFYLKYFITGHHYDPLNMGAFVGAILGGVFTIIKKIKHSVKAYNKLHIYQEKGFNN
ncbi:hypothetical protein [Polaribacter sargassicola]|uniref:hypothetical protein n=1 Tax=Polaribacter sargassicola TaxID=2836891 RepID=UPI001F3ABBA0|nr:hypothetical protein [Polaribacter sp. DS7-9]MCG1037521.1 hypothetical protein [Polaribacter sp. DS7-9]